MKRQEVNVAANVVESPFGAAQVEAAKAEFLANPGWKRIYDSAPAGAKRRLEISFWFSQNRDAMEPEMFTVYRNWRMDVERQMTEADLEYMIANMDKAPKLEGRNMSMFLSPKPVVPPKKPAKPKQPKPVPEEKPAEAEPAGAETAEAE